MTDDELKQIIIAKITQGQHTETELLKLREALLNANNQQFSHQVGKSNVNIGDGKKIHIGDNIYYLCTEEASEASVKAPRSSPIGLPQNIPHTGVINFVGRADELELLHQKLQEKNCVAISAIAGMGGVGKTELAIQYALTHKEDYSGGICWLRARDENIGEQIANFAQNYLGLKIPENISGLDNQVCWCWQHWPAGDVLIVLDDVNDYKLIKAYIPSANFRFRVLMTTRLELLQPSQRVELKVLKLEIAIALLESFISKEKIAESKIIAPKICNFLGCLPLGLELVGRYLQHKPDLSLAEMLQRLEEKRLKQQALEKSERLTSDMTAQLGVTAAFDLSWQELNPLAKDLSLFLSLFDLVPISWHLVEQCFSENAPEDLEEARDNFLVYLHLLQREGKETYKLHELIREFFQSKLVELAKANLPEAVALKIGEITAKNPLYSTEILQKGLLNWTFHPGLKLSALEWGKQLWIASQSWCDGLDKLSKLVMPLREDGSLPVLGVALVEKDLSSCRDNFIKSLPNAGAIAFEKILIDNPTLFSLITGWYFGSTIQENVVELPPEATKISEDNYSEFPKFDNLFELGWNNFQSSLLSKPNISTAWDRTFSDIVGNLSKLLQERSLSVSSGSLSFEAAWHGAIYLTRKHLINSYPNHYCDPISLDEIENHLFKINQSHFSRMMQHCLNQLKFEIEACRAKGQTHLSLSPSIQIFKSSSNISHEILLDYTADIFQQSIEGYEQVVNSLFIKLISKLQLASILPARLVGYVIPPQHHEDSISMSWYWESLPKGQKSHVNFSLVKDESSLNSSFPKTALFPMHLLKETPFTKSWLGDYPVTEMVYQWLWKDLNKIGWVKGNRLENAGFPYWR